MAQRHPTTGERCQTHRHHRQLRPDDPCATPGRRAAASDDGTAATRGSSQCRAAAAGDTDRTHFQAAGHQAEQTSLLGSQVPGPSSTARAVAEMGPGACSLLIVGDARDVGEQVRLQPLTPLTFRIFLRQRPQLLTRPLSDLAEFLRRPAVALTEGLTFGSKNDLMADDQAHIRREIASDLTEDRKLRAYGHLVHHPGPGIRELAAAFGRLQGRCLPERGFDRAATRQGTASVVDTTQQLLLDAVGGVRRVRERRSGLRPLDELQGRLRVAILQVLGSEAMSMRPQQEIAPSEGDARHKLGRVARARAGDRRSETGEVRRWFGEAALGRHHLYVVKRSPMPPLPISVWVAGESL